MATLSVRKIARECLDLTGNFSINTHVYGYVHRQTDNSLFGVLGVGDTLPGSGQPRLRSLRRHLQTISGEAADLAIVLVGHVPDFSGRVTRDQVTKIQYAIQIARDIYAQQNVGIRKIIWGFLTPAQAGGFVDIADRSEAIDLTDDWNGPNGGIDVFWVQSIGDAGGWSPIGGPCGKDSKFDMTGSVLSLVFGRHDSGILLAHEVGHVLGLVHGTDVNNVMGTDPDGDGVGQTGPTSTGLTAAQGATMRAHCQVFTKPLPYYGASAEFAIALELI
ncbi:hypothetical protein [Cryptosporangium sp. NPDC051539]|uniref:hypothetical protein n=1 Tax=Cryptosporangium sp. NPDC051539 TaxID=3363962 RepID=UPI0037976388